MSLSVSVRAEKFPHTLHIILFQWQVTKPVPSGQKPQTPKTLSKIVVKEFMLK